MIFKQLSTPLLPDINTLFSFVKIEHDPETGELLQKLTFEPGQIPKFLDDLVIIYWAIKEKSEQIIDFDKLSAVDDLALILFLNRDSYDTLTVQAEKELFDLLFGLADLFNDEQKAKKYDFLKPRYIAFCTKNDLPPDH